MALLYLNHATAREWPAEELAFVREVAQRTRMAVERRRAEQDLRTLANSLEAQVAARTRELMETEAALAPVAEDGGGRASSPAASRTTSTTC